ncbi:MAG: pyridoxine 5'-phosphate synthase [Candidatus Gastranaerophilales bacterium]|nr:pyridoxine 5'-phosphate synthase [Candidatus Gastranaerophilales bacterium]
MNLGVNIDHVATLRNARGGVEPSVLEAALICEMAGASAITVHLREDRRHIKDDDVLNLKKHLKANINLEMAATDEMQKIAMSVVPHSCCIVPEKRQELTTEGGLDVISKKVRIKELICALHSKNIIVSLFIDPDLDQIKAAHEVGSDYIELHTGTYSNAFGSVAQDVEFNKLKNAAEYAQSLGLKVNAGHGLNYENVALMNKIDGLCELNIGHSIVSRAIFVGLEMAVKEMIELI